MKRLFCVMLLLLICVHGADACVLKMLSVGVISSTEGQVLSEILAAVINERTGTSVTTKLYRDAAELYEAVRTKQVDIIIENTPRAAQMLNRPVDNNGQKTFEAVKAAYEKEKGLIWMKPFGFHPSTAPVLNSEILNNFPGLPRVLGKLAGVIDDPTYARLIKSVESGEKPKKVARDFLKSKKLI